MPPTPVGPGPKLAPSTTSTTSPSTPAKRGWEKQTTARQMPPSPPPTPPVTPHTAPERGWEMRPAAPRTPPASPPQTPGPAAASWRHAASPLLQTRLGAPPAGIFVRGTDAAGHTALSPTLRARLSPAERNMHDHWYGRIDRNFSSHATEFEALATPIASWQAYMALALDVVRSKNATTTQQPIANGKTRTYDSARNLLVLSATSDGHVITMFRPGINQIPESQQPKVLAPLVQGQRYVGRMR